MATILLSSKEVMIRLGYKCRNAFWACVYSQGIPHVRINARVIKFPEDGFEDWITRRSSDYR